MSELDEIKEDKLFRKHTGEISKFKAWDKIWEDKYTPEDIDREVENEKHDK